MALRNKNKKFLAAKVESILHNFYKTKQMKLPQTVYTVFLKLCQ